MSEKWSKTEFPGGLVETWWDSCNRTWITQHTDTEGRVLSLNDDGLTGELSPNKAIAKDTHTRIVHRVVTAVITECQVILNKLPKERIWTY